jgi:reverse gyrase
MPGQSASTHKNTLLIVESPTIARIIKRFDIPYLTVIATHGFCWIPQYDPSTDQLTLKVDPDKRHIRNRIRDQARWAAQIIIATDYDAAGDAIAYGIAKHLNRYDLALYRTPLQGLSIRGVQRAINRSGSLDPDNLTRRLKNRYLLNSRLKKISSKLRVEYPHVTLGLLFLLYHPHAHQRFISPEGIRFRSEHPLHLPWKENVDVYALSDIVDRYENFLPLSTADALQLIQQEGKCQNYKQAQKELNRLFTRVPASLQTGIISYPRTSARGYYSSTWQRIQQNWIKTQELETFRPPSSRPIIHDKQPHESIHPLQIQHTPSYVRPLVRKKYYDLYRTLYNYHLKVIQTPNLHRAVEYRESNSEYVLFTEENSAKDWKNHYSLHPYMNMGDLIHRLTSWKTIRPSRIGPYMDHLLKNNLIQLGIDGNVLPGPALTRVSSQIHNPEALKQFITEIHQQIDSSSFDADTIASYLNKILGN